MLKALFFDLDDTLIVYEPAARLGHEACAAQLGVDSDDLRRALYDSYTRHFDDGCPLYPDLKHLSIHAIQTKLTQDAFDDLGIPHAHLEDTIACFNAEEQRHQRVFEDTHAVLARLSQCIPLGIITNGPSSTQREKIRRHNLEPYFSHIVVDTEFGCAKPNPRLFGHAAALVGATPAELLFVGNSLEADVAGANGAGWTSVWFPSQGEERGADDPVPQKIITALAELLTFSEIRCTMGQ
jgi:HAD superfamily hydrolase (TIGR01549 family)